MRERWIKALIAMAIVDNANGMMFHKRRQSQDRIVREKILSMAAGKKLWMNAYSHRQFAKMDGEQIAEAEAFLESAGQGEYCFVENVPLAPYEEKIEKLILFHWNRRYPGDFFLDLDLSEKQWKLTESSEFAGSSHEKITMEIYCRE